MPRLAKMSRTPLLWGARHGVPRAGARNASAARASCLGFHKLLFTRFQASAGFKMKSPRSRFIPLSPVFPVIVPAQPALGNWPLILEPCPDSELTRCSPINVSNSAQHCKALTSLSLAKQFDNTEKTKRCCEC